MELKDCENYKYCIKCDYDEITDNCCGGMSYNNSWEAKRDIYTWDSLLDELTDIEPIIQRRSI